MCVCGVRVWYVYVVCVSDKMCVSVCGVCMWCVCVCVCERDVCMWCACVVFVYVVCVYLIRCM
jgi:hypothetical protein